MSSSMTRALSLRWWLCDRNGDLTLVQWPNPALSVWLATTIVGSMGLLGVARSATLADIGQGALLVWALDELVRGASPVRKLLGALVSVAQLVRLFT